MQIVNQIAENYAEKYTSPEDAVLKQVYKETVAHHPQAQMISGHVQGKFLEILSRIMQPKYILEIGTFTGYSAICLAKGLQPGGELHTIELRPEDAHTALINFKLAGMDKKIHLHTGNARDIIPQLAFTWDLVFIDADKTGYIEYLEMVVQRLNDNGLILADNVLFHGEVLNEPIDGKSALAIDAFNRHVAADEKTDQVMLTMRDGLMLIKKKSQ